MATRSPLSPLEADVLDVLWKLGGSTAGEIGEALAASSGDGRLLKDSTVRTILTRLEEKGYVRHTVEGRTYRYASVDSPRSLAARAVRQIIDRFCRGSVEALLTGMVAEDVIGPKELTRIAARLTVKTPAKKTGSSKRKEV